MELRLRHASELLPTFIAYHALCNFAFLEGLGLDGGVGFCICRRCGRGEFLKWFVLVVFEPLESSLYYDYTSDLKLCTINRKQILTTARLLDGHLCSNFLKAHLDERL
jgi:hypothetical protein